MRPLFAKLRTDTYIKYVIIPKKLHSLRISKLRFCYREDLDENLLSTHVGLLLTMEFRNTSSLLVLMVRHAKLNTGELYLVKLYWHNEYLTQTARVPVVLTQSVPLAVPRKQYSRHYNDKAD